MLSRVVRTFIIIISIAFISFLMYELWLKYEMGSFKYINGVPKIDKKEPLIVDTVELDSSVKIDKIIVFKERREMMLVKNDDTLKTYQVSLGKNPVGPKEKEGDKKTPEGKYILDWKNPNSKYHLSIHISYPNDDDKRNADLKGVEPGGDIMIHGCPNGFGWNWKYYKDMDWTDGCIAVSNEEIEEIWDVVENGTEIEIFP